MAKVKLTPAKLADIKKKAEAAENKYPSHWTCKRYGFFDYMMSNGEVIARCHYPETQAHIAASDPATVLALVAEIERLRVGSPKKINKPKCPPP